MIEFNKKAHNCDVKILQEDSRFKTSIEDDSVDLLLTSPPYGDSRTTVAYGQFSRLSLQWLDYNKKTTTNLDSKSLGGRKKYQNNNQILKSESLHEIIYKISKIDKKRSKYVL